MAENADSTQTEWTIGRLLAWTKDHFESHGVDEPRLAAEILLAEALTAKRIELYARFDQSPSAEERTTFREMVRLAVTHRPIAYLVGHKEFYSLDFIVNDAVLIPRPETELLVELALDWCKIYPAEQHELLDIGTGSGCVAIATAKWLPTLKTTATDISAAALTIARNNAERHGLSDRVRLVEADMLAIPPDAVPAGGFDIILSNPPYIGEQERDSLPPNVRDHEPAQALFSGEDGLDAYRTIAANVEGVLKPGGLLAIEVGHQQASLVEDIFAQSSNLKLLGRRKDLHGIDRAIRFTLPA